MNERRDMPYVGERCLFARKIGGGDEFLFYGEMIDGGTVRSLLYGTEIDWYLVSRWKREALPNEKRE